MPLVVRKEKVRGSQTKGLPRASQNRKASPKTCRKVSPVRAMTRARARVTRDPREKEKVEIGNAMCVDVLVT